MPFWLVEQVVGRTLVQYRLHTRDDVITVRPYRWRQRWDFLQGSSTHTNLALFISVNNYLGTLQPLAAQKLLAITDTHTHTHTSLMASQIMAGSFPPRAIAPKLSALTEVTFLSAILHRFPCCCCEWQASSHISSVHSLSRFIRDLIITDYFLRIVSLIHLLCLDLYYPISSYW